MNELTSREKEIIVELLKDKTNQFYIKYYGNYIGLLFTQLNEKSEEDFDIYLEEIFPNSEDTELNIEFVQDEIDLIIKKMERFNVDEFYALSNYIFISQSQNEKKLLEIAINLNKLFKNNINSKQLLTSSLS